MYINISYERAFSFILENDLLLYVQTCSGIFRISCCLKKENASMFSNIICMMRKRYSPETLDRKIVIDEAGFLLQAAIRKNTSLQFDDQMMEHLKQPDFLPWKKEKNGIC
jgi:hypothetical protein